MLLIEVEHVVCNSVDLRRDDSTSTPMKGNMQEYDGVRESERERERERVEGQKSERYRGPLMSR